MTKEKRGRGRPAGAVWPHVLLARFNAAQHNQLDRSAERLGTSRAGLLRRLVDEDLPKLMARERSCGRRPSR